MAGDLKLLRSYGLPGYSWPLDPEHLSRVWPYHGKTLANCGVPVWIARVAPYLESQVVRIRSVQNIGASDGYRILLDGRRYLIHPYGDCVDWSLSVISSVQIVNELLEAAGSEERGYILRDEGDDGLVVFLTAATHARLLADRRLLRSDPPGYPGTYARPSREAGHIFPANEVVERLVPV
jgi:hypothetical protein